MTLISSNPDFPLTFTELAAQKLIWALASEEDLEKGSFVRIKVLGGGCSGFIRSCEFDSFFDPEEDIDTLISIKPLLKVENQATEARVVVDAFSALYLKGVELGYEQQQFKEGFCFNGGPEIKKTCGCGSSVAY